MLMELVETACKGAGLHHDYSRRAELAIEELFANTVHHAYGGESDRPVWLHVSATGAGIFVEYQDAGPHFDPFEPADRPANAPSHDPSRGGQASKLIDVLAALSPEPPIGGQGRRLIKQLATSSAYRRLDGRNVVSLEFARKPQ
jgi:anti-sigma regulatory factor (Ser/Thr protein kinase)